MMEVKTVVVFLFCVACAHSQELKKEDDNVCEDEVVVSVKRVRQRYPCGKSRICTRWGRETEKAKMYRCCDDYIYSEGKCVPKKCTEACVNAECTSRGQDLGWECVCNDNFTRLNQTHCIPKCSSDQFNDLTDANFTCKSKCSKPCLNGNCTGTNTCSCYSGYKPKDQFSCEPKCDACENGTCEAPGDCKCFPRYRKDDDGKCKPVCEDCEHGSCLEPGHCECHSGYTKENEKCVPVCDEKCQNGICTAPNNCTCDKNYTKDSKNVFKCLPVCKNPCGNGTCDAPDHCKCNDGYEKNYRDICVPVCKSCNYGVCEKPDTCVCNKGYKMDETLNICKPVCEPSCVNATCVDINECQCFPGYESTNISNICKPVCIGCFNGDCVDPKVCQCHEGYELVNGTCLEAPLINCKSCDGVCQDGVCACANGSLCHQSESADVESTPTLAGLQLTWMLGGAVGILLIVVVTAVLFRMWRRRQSYDQKAPDNYDAYGSVVYTVPNTLVNREPQDPDYDDVEPEKQTDVGLLGQLPSEDCVERM